MAHEGGAKRRRGWVRWVVTVGAAALALVVAAALVAVVAIGRWDRESGQPTTQDCDASAIAIIAAAAGGRTDRVQEALDAGIDPDVRDRHGNSPLACAGAAGEAEVTVLLLDAGADPDTVARDGDTVVGDAVIFCRTEVLDLLLDAGADPEASGTAATPLAQAVDLGSTGSARRLLAAGADPDTIATRVTPLGRPESSPCPEETTAGRAATLGAVLEAGADPTLVLGEAIAMKAYATVGPALADGADPNGDLSSAEDDLLALLCSGADSGRDRSACHPVAGLGRLLDGPPDPETSTTILPVTGAGPVVPLLHAAWDGELAATQALLGAGADPNLIGPRGLLPLHAAAGAGHSEVAAVLLPLTTVPPPGDAPLPSEVARRAGHDDLAALLGAAGA